MRCEITHVEAGMPSGTDSLDVYIDVHTRIPEHPSIRIMCAFFPSTWPAYECMMILPVEDFTCDLF